MPGRKGQQQKLGELSKKIRFSSDSKPEIIENLSNKISLARENLQRIKERRIEKEIEELGKNQGRVEKELNGIQNHYDRMKTKKDKDATQTKTKEANTFKREENEKIQHWLLENISNKKLLSIMVNFQKLPETERTSLVDYIFELNKAQVEEARPQEQTGVWCWALQDADRKEILGLFQEFNILGITEQMNLIRYIKKLEQGNPMKGRVKGNVEDKQVQENTSETNQEEGEVEENKEDTKTQELKQKQ